MRGPTSVYTSWKHARSPTVHACARVHAHTHTPDSCPPPQAPPCLSRPHTLLLTYMESPGMQRTSLSLTSHVQPATKSCLYRPCSVYPTHPLSSTPTVPALLSLFSRGFLLQFRLISTSLTLSSVSVPHCKLLQEKNLVKLISLTPAPNSWTEDQRE